MPIKKELISRLKDFGLNSYEGKLWLALLSRGVSTAGELSDISDVPRSRAYDVLESLEKKGFIIVKLGKPIKYLAVPPIEVIGRVQKKIQEDASQKAKALDSLKESELLTELNTLHTKGIELVDPAERTGEFRGRDKVYEHISSMIKGAKDKVMISTTEEGLRRKARLLRNDIKKAHGRGVKVQISAPVSDHNKLEAKELSQYAEIRNAQTPSRFVIADDNMLVMLHADEDVHENYDSGVWFSTPFFVDRFSQMFATEWEQMKNF